MECMTEIELRTMNHLRAKAVSKKPDNSVASQLGQYYTFLFDREPWHNLWWFSFSIFLVPRSIQLAVQKSQDKQLAKRESEWISVCFVCLFCFVFKERQCQGTASRPLLMASLLAWVPTLSPTFILGFTLSSAFCGLSAHHLQQRT